MESCLEENEIVDLVTGNLPSKVRDRAENHLDQCSACRLVLIELARVFELRASALPQRSIDSASGSTNESLPVVLQPRGLARGSVIGRYAVLDVLGSGAMGIVYAAYDPELDRKVALKLLRGHKLTDAHRERLLREARATARLAHPNVVVVHDVGHHRGEMFMAMEFVGSGTLRAWQAESDRSDDEILDAYAEAAQGLAAAHRAGLVHRDFKPSNVLVGVDGRIRITDFGLARAASEFDSVPEPTRRDSEVSGSRSSSQLTQTGAIVGTPAYMSPEQFAGKPADARSDQFSFCVALYEALCGTRPFGGETFTRLAAAVAAGELQPSERFAALPRTLRDTLTRGLRVDPSARFFDMQAVLRSLQRARGANRSSRTRAWIGGSLVAGTLGVGAMISSSSAAPDPCEPALTRWREHWTSPRRESVATALANAPHPYAQDTAQRVQARLDELGEAWEHTYTDACNESPHSPVVACLERRGSTLEATLTALERGGPEALEHAGRAVQRLRMPTDCTDPTGASGISLPEPPTPIAERVAEHRGQLELAEALRATGQYEASSTTAQQVHDASGELAYSPLVAETLLTLGRAQRARGEHAQARDTLRDAVTLAWGSGHERTAFEAADELVVLTGSELSDPASASVWEALARASLGRLGGGKLHEADVEESVGHVAFSQGHWKAATAHFLAAYDLRTGSLPADHPDLVSTQSSLVGVRLQQGEYSQAIELNDQVLEVRRRTLGPDHPLLVESLQQRAVALMGLDRNAEATVALNTAHELALRTLGAEHPKLTTIRSNLAALASRSGDRARAVELYEVVLADQLRRNGDSDPDVGRTYHNLGAAYLRMHELDKAAERLHHALTVRERALGPDHPRVANTLNTLLALAMKQRDCTAAAEYGTRALQIVNRTEETDIRTRVGVAVNLANALICGKDFDRARVVATEGLQLVADHEQDLAFAVSPLAGMLSSIEHAAGNDEAAEHWAQRGIEATEDPALRAIAEYKLALVLEARDRPRALELARAALKRLPQEETWALQRRDIETFLEKLQR